MIKTLRKYANALRYTFKITNLQDEAKKLGINFITAGVIAVFITNHFIWSASIPSYLLVIFGIIAMLFGAIKRRDKL